MQHKEAEMQARLAVANAMATELISLAESLFGPMRSPWKYSGVVFRNHPPHLYYAPDTTTVQISLSLRAINDEFQSKVGWVERSDTHQSKAKPPGVARQLVTFSCVAKKK